MKATRASLFLARSCAFTAALAAGCGSSPSSSASTLGRVTPPEPTADAVAPLTAPSTEVPPEVETGRLTPRRSASLSPTSAEARGLIEYPRQAIRYPLRVPFARTVTVIADAEGSRLRLAVEVLDPAGTRLATGRARRRGGRARVRVDLEEGAHVVTVAGLGCTTGSFKLTIL